MKDRKRADRRRHSRRMKRRVKPIYWWWNPDYTPTNIGRTADNMKLCSCVMCGNPRKHTGRPTRQELRARDIDEDY